MNKRTILEIRTEDTASGTLLYIPDEVVPYFKQLLRRGCMYWEKAPIEISEFVSSWVEDLPTQHYRINSIHKTAKELAEHKNGSTARGIAQG